MLCDGARSRGQFPSFHNHAPLLAALEIGRVTVRDSAGSVREFAASGGFLEVKHNDCTLLAESAESAETIDLDRARTAKAHAEQALAAGKREDADSAHAHNALRRARNRIAIAERKR